MMNVLFVFPGHCRTFTDCIDNCFKHIITKLFLNIEVNIHIYFYLKINILEPRGDSNFVYEDINYDDVINKITELKIKYNNITIDYLLLFDNEISDKELLLQVKDRTKYILNYSSDKILLRGMHSHYNFESCGNYIINKQIQNGYNYDYIIYTRPDIYFTDDCETIDKYDTSTVTIGERQHYYNDYTAIIPNKYLHAFFFDRMNFYRNNDEIFFDTPEMIYLHTIKYNIAKIGNYYIKRQL